MRTLVLLAVTGSWVGTRRSLHSRRAPTGARSNTSYPRCRGATRYGTEDIRCRNDSPLLKRDVPSYRTPVTQYHIVMPMTSRSQKISVPTSIHGAALYRFGHCSCLVFPQYEQRVHGGVPYFPQKAMSLLQPFMNKIPLVPCGTGRMPRCTQFTPSSHIVTYRNMGLPRFIRICLRNSSALIPATSKSQARPM